MSVEEAAAGRRQRSDKGTVRLSERDVAVFHWLAEMKAIYEADLRILLARLGSTRPGPEAVRAVIRRWERAGYAKAQKLLVGQPRIVWLLPSGATVVGEQTWKETAAVTALHQAEVARVRLWLEGRSDLPGGGVTEWESERRFRQRQWDKYKDGTRNMHVPDAVVTFSDGTRAALEIELTPKQQSRLQRIVQGLTTAYGATIYAVPAEPGFDGVRRQIRTAYEDTKAGKGEHQPLRTLPLVIWDYPSELEG